MESGQVKFPRIVHRAGHLSLIERVFERRPGQDQNNGGDQDHHYEFRRSKSSGGIPRKARSQRIGQEFTLPTATSPKLLWVHDFVVGTEPAVGTISGCEN